MTCKLYESGVSAHSHLEKFGSWLFLTRDSSSCDQSLTTSNSSRIHVSLAALDSPCSVWKSICATFSYRGICTLLKHRSLCFTPDIPTEVAGLHFLPHLAGRSTELRARSGSLVLSGVLQVTASQHKSKTLQSAQLPCHVILFPFAFKCPNYSAEIIIFSPFLF